LKTIKIVIILVLVLAFKQEKELINLELDFIVHKKIQTKQFNDILQMYTMLNVIMIRKFDFNDLKNDNIKGKSKHIVSLTI
jgi:hypothetical protein